MEDNQSLIRFLQEELGVQRESLDMAIRQASSSMGSIPMILWQYGLIDLAQLERVFDWGCF